MKNPDSMIHSSKFTCIIDTNVIYPIEIRDVIFWFAHYNMFTMKWSKLIFNEWEEVMRRKNIDEIEIVKRINRASQAFPDALVENYQILIHSLELKDIKDKHVLAAAIKANANIIVTNNLKDFPEDYLMNFGLEAKSADDFLADIIDLNPILAVKAFRELVLNRKNPIMDEYQVLGAMRKNGLQQTADYLHSLI